MLGAVPVEVGETTLVLGPFDIVAASAAAGERVLLALGRRHRLGVDVAVAVCRGICVALDAEGVSRAAAGDTEFGIGAGQVDSLAAVAYLDVIWIWDVMFIFIDISRQGGYDILSNTWADSVSPPKTQFLR